VRALERDAGWLPSFVTRVIHVASGVARRVLDGIARAPPCFEEARGFGFRSVLSGEALRSTPRA